MYLKMLFNTTLNQVISDRFEGLILSDGNISKSKNGTHPRYQQTCKEPTLLKWCRDNALIIEANIGGPYCASGYWMLRSRNNPELDSWFVRWYGSGKKALPSDFVISPYIMMTAFLGDGSLNRYPGRTSFIKLAFTYGLVPKDRERIAEMLNSFHFEASIQKAGDIRLSCVGSRKFLDWIGPCPVPLQKSYGYKFDYVMANLPGKSRPGIHNGMSKLTPEDVKAIRTIQGKTQIEIAKDFNINQTTVSCIRLGKTWKS